MARETLKSFLNTKASTAGQDSISFSHNKQTSLKDGNDIKIDPASGEKLLAIEGAEEDELVGLLGDYLNYITLETNNMFGILPGNEPAAPSNRGSSLVLAEEQGSDKVFVVQGTEAAKSMNSYSNSQFKILNDTVDKVGFEEDLVKGHELLSSIPGSGLSTSGNPEAYKDASTNSTLKAVENDILSKSRFGNIPDKTVFKKNNETNDAFEASQNLKINRTYGSHFNEHEDKLVKLAQLKSFGASLMMKASGFDQHGNNPERSANPEDLANKMSTQEIRSSMLQQNNSIPSNLTRAKNAFNFPTIEGSDQSIRSGRGEFTSQTDDRTSFGVKYNSELHFNGKNHKLHKIQAAISIKALTLLSRNYYDKLISSFVDSDASMLNEEKVEGAKNESNFGNMFFGQSRRMYNLKLGLLKEAALVPTIYAYKDCFERGLEVLFDDRIDKTVESLSNSKLKQSPGFWLSIASSMLKTYEDTLDKLAILSESSGSEMIQRYSQVLSSNNLVRYINAIATVGDASLQAFSGKSLNDIKNYTDRPRNVDSLPDGPGTRVGKSRKKNGIRDRQLAWSQNDVPSAYLLPLNAIRAAGRLDKIVSGPNPFSAMIGSELVDQTYLSINVDGTGGRIPKEVVKGLEDRLDAEYVPFYFQDLRTNEIVSFHAFLDQLTDTIAPNYNQTSGYGRLDPVRIYESTTRSISVGFTILATSKEDFNTMWYKINKFVTFLYPQWTKGTMVGRDFGGATSTFVQPFSQVLGASPIVRMRVGDVIKSNYSRFNFARIFGIGDSDVSPMIGKEGDSGVATFFNASKSLNQKVTNKIKDISVIALATIFGSPIQFTNTSAVKSAASKGGLLGVKTLNAASSIASNYLINGFANPLTVGLVLDNLKDPNAESYNSYEEGFGILDAAQRAGHDLAGKGSISGPNKGRLGNNMIMLKANSNTGYKVISDSASVSKGKKLLIPKPVKAEFVEIYLPPAYTSAVINNKTKSVPIPRIMYKIKLVDFSLPTSLFNVEVICEPNEIFQIPNTMLRNTLSFGIALYGSGGFLNPALDTVLGNNHVKDGANSLGIAPAIDILRALYLSNESTFMEPSNNPFVKAYESTAGRGLAGTVGTVTFDWLSDFNWEIDHNSRAPMGCKISFNFDVIHDIVPGLDHSGYNRAPLYNVGDIMQGVSGDSHEDFSSQNEFRYRKAGAKGIKIK